MGYARLYFPNAGTVTIANVIRDIVGVISGTYTATNQLLAATQNLSEIVNSAGRGNWTRVYPSTVTASLPQVLSTTCLNGATKFIRIMGAGHNTDGQSNTNTGGLYQYTPSITSGVGVAMQSCTAAASATSVTNPSFVNQSGSTIDVYNIITGNNIYLSWSSRHCLIIGNQGSGSTGSARMIATGCFEHNNTGISQSRSTAPFIHCQWADFQTSAWPTAATPTTSGVYNQSTVSIMNHYSPVTTTITGSFNFTSNVINREYNTVSANGSTTGSYPSFYTKNSSGAIVQTLQPLFFHQHNLGIPHCYISDLCKVYRTQPGVGAPGDTLTVGSDTYMYFPIYADSASTNAATMALAVLRA